MVKYIREQIESILNQTMKVGEIVICGDGAIDEIVALFKALLDNKGVGNYRFIRNDE